MLKKRMKVMIAYDGSIYADAAIDDLRRAGLSQNGEALIISVADIFKTSIATSGEIGVLGRFVSSRLLEKTIALTQREKARVRNAAIKLAVSGGRRVLSILPGWRIEKQVALGDPAEELLKKADEFKPDLIIAGSHGRSAIGRFFLGSVSQRIAEEASCSVRVVRQRGFGKEMGAPTRIILGASSLPDLDRVVRAVGRHVLSDKPQVRLIKVDDGVTAGRLSFVYPYAPAILESIADELRALRFEVSVRIERGNLQSVLLEEAENWEADSIFVVAGADNEPGLSPAASSLITGAGCTVEVVR